MHMLITNVAAEAKKILRLSDCFQILSNNSSSNIGAHCLIFFVTQGHSPHLRTALGFIFAAAGGVWSRHAQLRHFLASWTNQVKCQGGTSVMIFSQILAYTPVN